MHIICKGSGKDAQRQKWRFLLCTPSPLKVQVQAFLDLFTFLFDLLRSFCNCASPWLLMRRVPKNLELLLKKNNPEQRSQTCGASKNLGAVPIMSSCFPFEMVRASLMLPWFERCSCSHVIIVTLSWIMVRAPLMLL